MSGRCVYCLDDFDLLTEDHVFPLSWYPNTTPTNLGKWKVPACKVCNEKYGRLERDLLIRLGLCVDPQASRSSGIAQKAMRAINPFYARQEKDRLMRQLTREKILKQTVRVKNTATAGIFPGFGPKEYRQQSEHLGILLPADELRILGCKMVRGITYILDQLFIEETHKIDVFLVTDENAQYTVDIINRFGSYIDCGPGIRVGRATAHDDRCAALLMIEIWGKLRIYSAVEKVGIT